MSTRARANGSSRTREQLSVHDDARTGVRDGPKSAATRAERAARRW